MRFYTGVGSRQTPPPILDIMYEAGRRLAVLGWVLRSGHAEGADAAFEAGCDAAGGAKEIFLPWARFNCSTSSFHGAPAAAFDIARRIHPAWNGLTDDVRKCQARDIQQVLGPALDRPSVAILAWTEGGAFVGGTATALRLAAERGIMVLNLGALEIAGLGAGDLVARLEMVARTG